MFERFKHIALEGPIGVGKTSLAHKLAERFHAQTLFEAPEQNPFLPRFYEAPTHFALATQLNFLMQRIAQNRDFAQWDLRSRPLVTDFLLEKDPLFAALTLSADELKLYQTIWQELKPVAPKPDLVIALQAPVETLYGRIHKRQIKSEAGITLSYLTALVDAYSHFFHHYDAAPVLVVDTTHLNPIEDDNDFALLLEHIKQMRGRREFFNKQS